jgi:hypothetical protein
MHKSGLLDGGNGGRPCQDWQSRLLLIQQPPALSACSLKFNLQGHNPTAVGGWSPGGHLDNQKIIRQSSAITRPSQSFLNLQVRVCVGMENPNFSRINMPRCWTQVSPRPKPNKLQVELVQTSSLQKLERSFDKREPIPLSTNTDSWLFYVAG